jgi:predicted  nucleic acid-binding Zn-ribbon protein
MTLSDLNPYLQALLAIWTLGNTVVLFLRKPGEDASQSVVELKEHIADRIDGHAERLTRIESHMEHMPTNEDLSKLEGTVKQIQQQTQGISDSMGQLRSTLTRIEDFLHSSRR